MYRYLGQLEGWGWGEEQQKEKQVAQWGRTGVREEIGGQKQHPTRGSERVNRQEGQGSPNGGHSLQVSDIFISLKRQEETN